MRKHALWLMLLLTAAVWAGNFWYYERHQLTEPVLFEHRYDFTPFKGQFIDLYYVTHRDHSERLVTVQPSEEIMWYVRGVSVFGSYGPYTVHKANVQLGPEGRELDAAVYGTFTELKLQFDRGSAMTAPVGQITLRPPSMEKRLPLLSMISGSSSSTGENEHVSSANVDLRVTAASHTLEQQLGERLHVSVHKMMHEEVQVPFDLKAGEALRAEQRIDPPAGAGARGRMESVGGELRVELQPADASAAPQSWINPISLGPEPDRRGIAELIARRERGKTDGG
ncbi:hypothetical protein SAMN02799630_02352 [Paenibacillus sp. UNCCL117]|uniref:hypothetical protein n=1 Tax=unclassified Paenibacillus TaxID=185978 RepID=UPI0008824731|nr:MULTISPECIES: hypothetical protein [unclassified Paenibacillus]SDD18536.1 hypothetical protein SAMN04488602_106228 [Paenibacillus sp. cl123]SFW35265.1 hypothetical protein SAMN02799630_02352 [Paenibacillus sp. UNCCL117]